MLGLGSATSPATLENQLVPAKPSLSQLTSEHATHSSVTTAWRNDTEEARDRARKAKVTKSVISVIFQTRGLSRHYTVSFPTAYVDKLDASSSYPDFEISGFFSPKRTIQNPAESTMSAGPSRLRGSEATQTQNGSLKRKRYETVEEMFETVAPEENEELSRQYRQLIQKADGMLAASLRLWD